MSLDMRLRLGSTESRHHKDRWEKRLLGAGICLQAGNEADCSQGEFHDEVWYAGIYIYRVTVVLEARSWLRALYIPGMATNTTPSLTPSQRLNPGMRNPVGGIYIYQASWI